MGDPLHRKPFHGPIRADTLVPRKCVSVGKLKLCQRKSSGLSSFASFTTRLPEFKSSATGFWTDLEVFVDHIVSFLSLRRTSIPGLLTFKITEDVLSVVVEKLLCIDEQKANIKGRKNQKLVPIDDALRQHLENGNI
uniref:Uncharacterized protein n=1 Tax=Solanum lycopersicum TaxID=4081 RepID=A0A3Q7H191_SOLLC